MAGRPRSWQRWTSRRRWPWAIAVRSGSVWTESCCSTARREGGSWREEAAETSRGASARRRAGGVHYGVRRAGVDRAVWTQQEEAPAHLGDSPAAAGGDLRRRQAGDDGLGGQPTEHGPAGAPICIGQRWVTGHRGPAQCRRWIVGKLVEENVRPADVEHVEGRALDLPENAQIVRPLEAATLGRSRKLARRHVG